MASQAEQFPSRFNYEALRVLAGDSGQACFGLNVLESLVRGIVDYRREYQSKKRGRSLGPALLGAFMWLDDQELLQAIADYSAACVVVSKQPAVKGKRSRSKQETFERLRRDCDSGKGFPAKACPEFCDLAPHEGGEPYLVGPGSPPLDITIPVFRSIGPRKTDNHLVPILHAKMVLLGHLWWHDEGPLGHAEEIVGFTPEKLWVGSANGTRSSRSNLEVGMWLTQPELLRAAREFLTEVIRDSEDIDSAADQFEPELLPVEFDDDAMAEAAARILWDEEAGEEYPFS